MSAEFFCYLCRKFFQNLKLWTYKKLDMSKNQTMCLKMS